MRPGHAARYDAEYERNGVGHLLLYYGERLMIGGGPMWRRIMRYRPGRTGMRRSVEEDYPQEQRIMLGDATT